MKRVKSNIKSQKSNVKNEGGFEGECKSQSRDSSQLLIFLCCLLVFYLPLMGCREKSEAAEQAPTSVKVKAVELSQVKNGVRYSANIIPHSQVELAFKVGGYVERILQARGVDGRMRDVQAGDSVTRGTVLARVRQSDYAVKVSQAESQAAEAKSALESSHAQFTEVNSSISASKAQLAEAEAAFDKARLDFDRAKNLFSSQSLTKADYDAARTHFDTAEAKRNAARSQVAMLEARANAAGAQIEVTRAKMQGAQALIAEARSEERRVGKEGRARW